ncbi:MAG: STAS domain-containing protein [Candidatus Ozemobacteraceae bacterium]
MPLAIRKEKRDQGYYVLELVGKLDTLTSPDCEKVIDEILADDGRAIIFDLKGLEFISSMGLRVILKARKELAARGGAVATVQVQPQVAKVFEIAQIVPLESICESIEECDRYLASIQRQVLEKQGKLTPTY